VQLLQQVEPGTVGQVLVQQDEVGGAGLYPLARLVAAVGTVHGQALLFEMRDQE
jgi:hypothetical protein